MTFVLGRPHPAVQPCWYVVSKTADPTFVDRCRGRGMESFVSEQGKLGLYPSVDMLSRFMLAPAPTFVNPSGGGTDRLDVLSTVEADTFPCRALAPRDFTIHKWPMGTHFYVELPNGESLEWNGRCKWDTEDEARAAIQGYITHIE